MACGSQRGANLWEKGLAEQLKWDGIDNLNLGKRFVDTWNQAEQSEVIKENHITRPVQNKSSGEKSGGMRPADTLPL